jgi:NADH-quinone oxidoreductase subunit M
MGVYPETFMRPIRNDVGRLLERLEPVAPPGDSQLVLGKPKLQVIDANDHHGAAH